MSTKTHWSWSPIARCTSAAVTAESTPPESAHSTRSVPTAARIDSTDWSTKELIDQPALSPARWNRKFSRTRWPWGVCATSGWNCTA